MANGLLNQFDRWKPGESKGLIDPNWAGAPRGSGTQDPRAVDPLLWSTGARIAASVPGFVSRGSKEIIAGAEDVVNLARKFPYHIAKNLIQGEETARQLKKVTEQIKGREYPHDVRVEEDDAGEFLGPGVFGEDDVDIPEDEELLDKQLRDHGFDPDAIVERAEEKIKIPDNVVSLTPKLLGRGPSYVEVTRSGIGLVSNVKDKIERGEILEELDQQIINKILFEQPVVDDDLNLEGWSEEGLNNVLESGFYGYVDRLFEGLEIEEIEFVKDEMEVIAKYTANRLRRIGAVTPFPVIPEDRTLGEATPEQIEEISKRAARRKTGEEADVIPFPIDAEDKEPEDEVVFGESELLSFPQSRTIGQYEVRTELQKDKTYKVYVKNNNTEETKEVPYIPETIALFFGDMNKADMGRLIDMLSKMFQED